MPNLALQDKPTDYRRGPRGGRASNPDMAFKFSEAKFSSDIWKTLKARISNDNSGAAVQTHYLCQYCQPLLNNNKMPGRCVLNGLEVEPVPQDLQKLDTLSKQLI